MVKGNLVLDQKTSHYVKTRAYFELVTFLMHKEAIGLARVRNPQAVIIIFLLASLIPSGVSTTIPLDQDSSQNDARYTRILSDNYDDFSQGDFSGVNLSLMTLFLSLDEASATVNGTLLIDFYNGDAIPFDRIPFHLYTSGMQYGTRNERGIIVENVTTIEASPVVQDFEVLADQQLMWVNLDSSLQPGEFVSLNMTFQTLMPDGQDRSGFFGTDLGQTKIYTFANSYPMPCVYDEFDGWNTDPYLDVGDPFHFDMAFYDLYIEVPEEMVVAATGAVDSINTVTGRSTHHYDIPFPVREITFSASRYYQVESTVYHGVNVSAFFLPITADLWETDALVMATRSLELFNSTFGIFPYSTLNIVEQHAFYSGMEYPCQVYITHRIGQQILDGTRNAAWFELTIVHEVAHQFWSQLVGDDCVDWGFLDEGLTCWSHSYYVEVYYSDWEYFQVPPYLDSVRTFYATWESASIINQSNLVRPDLTGYVDYTQTPLILEKLRLTIGHDVFLSGLKDFFEDQYFQIATLNDLQASFEEVYGSDLDWFFMPWFGNGYLPDYAIENAFYDSSTLLLTFEIIDLKENQNEYSYSQQIPLLIYDALDEVVLDTIVWVNGTTAFSFELAAAPSSITLDYSDYILVQLPDVLTTSYSISGAEIGVLLPYGLDVIFIGGVFLASGILVIVIVLIEKRK